MIGGECKAVAEVAELDESRLIFASELAADCQFLDKFNHFPTAAVCVADAVYQGVGEG